MLNYKIRLTNDDFKQESLDWGEKYLDPNLSFVSGVTDASNHLEKYVEINASNDLINNGAVLRIDSENVIREGYVIVKGKHYKVHSGDTYVDYSVNESGDVRSFEYIFLNGKYYYLNNNEFHINDWLTEISDFSVSGISITVNYIASADSGTAKIDTIYWIEGGNVVIDGVSYIYDKNRNGLYLDGIESSNTLNASEITQCEGIEYRPYPTAADYEEVTKFRLTKNDDLEMPFERVTFVNYYQYVQYKNHYCSIHKITSGDTYYFICDVPKYIYDPINYHSVGDGFMEYPLYLFSEYTNGDLINDPMPISSGTFDYHHVRELTDLNDVMSYIIVDNDVYYVKNELQNANDGKEIGIYLEDETTRVVMGDILRFADSENNHQFEVYEVHSDNEYGFNEEESDFIIYANKKYYIEKDICDKIEISGKEYPIEYINGKVNGADCLVEINGEEVPFKISGDTLVRYGYAVISPTSSMTISINEADSSEISSITISAASEAVYEIKSYDGVIINDRKFLVKDGYAQADNLIKEYLFIVKRIIGSSLLVCVPYLNTSEYTDSFIENMSFNMCNDVVESQMMLHLYSRNKIFGEKEITKDLAFLVKTEPNSSDDYYDLFKNLTIYCRNGYINIPLQLSTDIANDTIQDNIIKRDFFEKEMKNAINPIIDMEKDVYYPKYIENSGSSYSGSSTHFKPIRGINLNLHFRTRDVGTFGNWKVNEGYNDVSTSGTTDNWFITDFHPYKDVIDDVHTSDKTFEELQESSDLLGLLFFTNDDVYYQKNKLAKSFVRLSYYDSTDPQKQELLATSTVFIDEHSIFKKYIDNSKKNVNRYKYVNKDEDGTFFNTVSVFTEYYGSANNSDFNNVEMVKYMAEDTNRTSSRLTIKNRYETDTSSEGFYLYMFKEYSEKLSPKPIYMKVEFNHAGVGKTIPFTIPMHWSGTSVNNGEVTFPINGTVTPLSALTIQNDLTELKNGCPLSYVYAQSYIPLYAVYDFENKEYGYVFDDRYFTKPSLEKIYEDGIVNLNLFELKIANEDTASDEEYKAIANGNQVKAAIDVNEKFKKNDLICD